LRLRTARVNCREHSRKIANVDSPLLEVMTEKLLARRSRAHEPPVGRMVLAVHDGEQPRPGPAGAGRGEWDPGFSAHHYNIRRFRCRRKRTPRGAAGASSVFAGAAGATS